MQLGALCARRSRNTNQPDFLSVGDARLAWMGTGVRRWCLYCGRAAEHCCEAAAACVIECVLMLLLLIVNAKSASSFENIN